MLRRSIDSALYVDWANINPKFPSGTLLNALPAWLAWLEHGNFDPKARPRKFVEKRVYINDTFRRYSAALEAAGFDVIPSSDDMLIALDASGSAHGKRIKEYILLTLDEEFVHLLERLGNRRKERVVTVKEGEASARSFPKHCEIVIPLDKLEAAFDYKPQSLGLIGRLMARIRARAVSHRPPLPAATAPTDAFLTTVAGHIAALAHSKPGVALSRNSLLPYLQKNMRGFNPHPYRRYRHRYDWLLRRVAATRTDLQLFRNADGRIAIMAPTPPSP